MGRKIFVGGLPWSFGEAELREAFDQFGTITYAKVVMDRDTGRSRGFGFVEYSSDAEAQAAIAGMDQQDCGGRRVNVNEAKERAPRSGGDRRGGGGYKGRDGGGGGSRPPRRQPSGNRWGSSPDRGDRGHDRRSPEPARDFSPPRREFSEPEFPPVEKKRDRYSNKRKGNRHEKKDDGWNDW